MAVAFTVLAALGIADDRRGLPTSVRLVIQAATVVAYVAVSFALAAAFLNAAFDFCLGCEMYLIGRRLLHR